MSKWQWAVVLILVVNSTLAWSKMPEIAVQGLFANSALININGKQRLLKAGKVSPEGVKLISSNSSMAVVQFNGKQIELYLKEHAHISTDYKQTKSETVFSIWPIDGLYRTIGKINNLTVEFLVDTGATSVAFDDKIAKELGIDYINPDKKIKIRTANGTASAYQVSLASVTIGEITLQNVKALVLEKERLNNTVLLGMSFLGQLDIERNSQRMIIRKNF